MEFIVSFAHYVFVLGAGQGILLAMIQFAKKENRLANRILAYTMLAFSLDLLHTLYFIGEYYREFPWFIAVTGGFPYLYGPCIYLYVYILGRQQEGFKKVYWLHFIPFGLVYAYGILFFYFRESSYKLGLLESGTFPLPLALVSLLLPVHGCIYALFTLLEARTFNEKLKLSYSNISKIGLRWLNMFALAAVFIWSIVVLSHVFGLYREGPTTQMNVFIYIAVSVFIYAVGYKSLKQPEVQMITSEEPTGSSLPEQSHERPGSYKKSGLNEAVAREYQSQLVKLMEEKKPYLDSQLSLLHLSNMLSLTTHNLSEVINSQFKQNFYDFINRYRVEEVKRLIEQDVKSSYNLLALGYEAGFSSKSSYYTAFKKNTEMTPAQYREHLLRTKAG